MRGVQGSRDTYIKLASHPDQVVENKTGLTGGPAPNLGIHMGQAEQQRGIGSNTAASNSGSDVSRSTINQQQQSARGKEAADDGPRVELEDTEEARKRTERLAMQEEKIFCNPEDDPFHMPEMKATSYPGEEWNPYGEASYVADWRDD
jgi:serine/arginine repetitive matrix protein 2